MKVIGVDEAGRGPVIGSMFVVAVKVDENDLPKLKTLGVKDSKKLTPKRREKLAKILMGMLDWSFREVKPQEIDEGNINDLTIKYMVEVVEELFDNEVGAIYADYVNGLEEALKKFGVKVVVEPKGERHLPVAAASVIAKYLREEHIRELKKKYGDFGSGYPSDHKTKDWLFMQKELPPIVRKRWKTVRRKRTLEEFFKG